MRIWDISPKKLCRNHLLGEHRELHAIWAVITKDKKGYSNHPETLRWKGRLKALYLRHAELVKDMKRRGYNHQSPLPASMAKGASKQTTFVDTYKDQLKMLRKKACNCKV